MLRFMALFVSSAIAFMLAIISWQASLWFLSLCGWAGGLWLAFRAADVLEEEDH